MAAHKSITGNHWCTVRKLAFSVKVHGATPAFVRDYHCFVCTACHPFRDGCCEYTGSLYSFLWERAGHRYTLIAICNATAVFALPSAWWRGQLHWGARAQGPPDCGGSAPVYCRAMRALSMGAMGLDHTKDASRSPGLAKRQASQPPGAPQLRHAQRCTGLGAWGASPGPPD